LEIDSILKELDLYAKTLADDIRGAYEEGLLWPGYMQPEEIERGFLLPVQGNDPIGVVCVFTLAMPLEILQDPMEHQRSAASFHQYFDWLFRDRKSRRLHHPDTNT